MCANRLFIETIMKQYLIQYIDHEDEDTNKDRIVRGMDIDDAELNLFRKTKCNNFTVLHVTEIHNNFVNNR